MARKKYELTDQDRLNRGYYQREEGMNVMRMFIFIIVGVGFLAGFLAIATPNGVSAAQPVVRMNVRCLIVPGLFVTFFLLRAFWNAITASWSERREVKRMEKARRVQEMADRAPVVHQTGPIRKFNEPTTQSSPDGIVEEMKDRQQRIRKAKAEQSWKKQERRGVIMKPALMSWDEYLSKVWSKEEIQQWMEKFGGGWQS